MAVSPEFREHVLELLEPLGAVSVKRFFGGAALVLGAAQFGMIMGETVFLRVDDSNRDDFVEAGSRPFSHTTKVRKVTVATYYSLPEELIDDQDALLEWARRSADVARKNQKRKPSKARRRRASS